MIRSSVRTFVETGKCGSLTKAAEKLFITPSAAAQQIRTLEHDLGATLLNRSPRGVELTAEGLYLFSLAQDLLAREEEIKRHLREMAMHNREICVATSMLEKCRALYDLWMRYVLIEPDCAIQMVNIEEEHRIPEKADLVESPNGRVSWMQNWEFLEICKVPFGLALDRGHPLYAKERLSLEDLRGETVVCFANRYDAQILKLFDDIRAAGGTLTERAEPSNSVFTECAFHHYILLAPLCWKDTLTLLEIRTCSWEYKLPYGIFYRKGAREEITRFLHFVEETVRGNGISTKLW